MTSIAQQCMIARSYFDGASDITEAKCMKILKKIADVPEECLCLVRWSDNQKNT